MTESIQSSKFSIPDSASQITPAILIAQTQKFKLFTGGFIAHSIIHSPSDFQEVQTEQAEHPQTEQAK